MILIDVSLNGWQTKYQILTVVVALLVPLAYYLYARYVTSRPNRYNSAEDPLKLLVAVPDAAAPHWKGKRLNPPTIRMPDDPNTIQSYCPATGQYLGTFTANTPAEIDEKIAKARKAQQAYAATASFLVRRRLLKTLARYIVDHQEDFARVACRDSGKTRVDALMGEILVTLEKLQWVIAHGEKALKPSVRPGPAHRLIGMIKQAEVRYEPLGVVAAIVSWNYPFHNLMGPVIASLFTGNAIIVKCSEQVVWSSVWFLKVIHTALKLLGLSEDLVQLCYCYPDTADHFTSHPGLDHITFIGSKPVAHKVVASAAKQLTPCVVELGGKDAVIVLDDVADVPALASVIMRGTFQSAGQNCIGIERVISLPGNYDRLVSIFDTRIKDLRLGSDIDQLDEIDVGAMISDNRFAQLTALVDDAVSKGARLLHGGKQFHHPNYPQGHYFEPTLLVDVTPEMRIFNEEVFGPILTMIKAQDAQDAVKLANATEYGLGGSVFSGDFNAANSIANQLQTGNVAINDFATFYVCQLPFGGVKKSGYGKFGGEEGLRGLCVEKLVVMDKSVFRAMGVATSIPPPVDYPIKSDLQAWTFVSSLNKAGYDTRTWEIVKGIRKLASGGK